MLHLILYVLLALVVAVGLFLLATRFLPAGEQIAPPVRDEPVWELPDERHLHAEDVDGVRLPVALRGYRFAETDILLDRLAGELRVRDRASDLVVEQLTAELRARDAEIARLRGEPMPASDAPIARYVAPPVAGTPVASEPGDERYAPPAHDVAATPVQQQAEPGADEPG